MLPNIVCRHAMYMYESNVIIHFYKMNYLKSKNINFEAFNILLVSVSSSQRNKMPLFFLKIFVLQ